MILITGASGNLGRAVLDEVLKTGKPIRAMYRSQLDAGNAPVGASTVIADFSSKDSLNRALGRCRYRLPRLFADSRAGGIKNNVIEACQSHQVKHVVLNSALGAGDYPKSFPAWHRLVEDNLRASGLGYTVLRPNSFMQNILAFFAPGIRTTGAFYAGYGEARISYIDLRDIASVASNILAAPEGHVGKTYELNGPDAVTAAELAERISCATDRSIKYVDIPESAQQKSMLELGLPEWQVDALLDLQRYYTNGQGGEVTDVLPRLLGRPPVTLDQFLDEFKDQFRSQAAGA